MKIISLIIGFLLLGTAIYLSFFMSYATYVDYSGEENKTTEIFGLSSYSAFAEEAVTFATWKEHLPYITGEMVKTKSGGYITMVFGPDKAKLGNGYPFKQNYDKYSMIRFACLAISLMCLFYGFSFIKKKNNTVVPNS